MRTVSSKRKQQRSQHHTARAKHYVGTFLRDLLSTPVSGASLAAFRIGVGLLMALEGYAMLVPHDAAITSGTPLERYYTGPDITFHWPYEGFEWLPILPSSFLYGLVGLLCVAGVTMSIGLCYRLSAVTVFSIWAYLFAVESTRTYWQSHYYLELLTCFLILWMPAATCFSVDAWWRGNRSETVPFWTLFVLRGQLVIAYFYAGMAKFHADWLLDAIPMRWFLADPNVTTPYEPYLSDAQLLAFQQCLHSPQLAYALCRIGTVFDVVVGFLLLFRRTRIFGLILMLIFHTTNYMLIFDDIGWFPILGSVTALIFLDADWPRRFWAWVRRPHFARPDRVWALVGGIVFPIIGVSLGWRLRPTPTGGNEKNFRLHPMVLPCVLGWLVWQSLLPLRHHFIDSDARFTYEGFSFSWRLKADTRHAFGHSLRIVDSKVISDSTYGRALIDWNAWPYDSVIYRRVQAGALWWPSMPELAVVMEPVLGERIIYNPYSGRSTSRADDVAAQRAKALWRELYGHDPTVIVPQSVSQTVRAIIESCQAASVASEQNAELSSLVEAIEAFEQGRVTSKEASKTLRQVHLLIRQLLAHERAAEIVRPIVRQMYPLALHGESRRPTAFFILEDPQVLTDQADGSTQINRSQWKHGSSTRQPGIPQDEYVGPTPLIVYMGTLGADSEHLLPLAYISDVHGDPKTLPRINWNSLRDMSISKYMHASGQAFYLRRYARRVASIWEDQCQRRLAVYATTRVSYNGRPHQELVDPKADLAQVSVRWFSHNAWIRDLEMERIPREAVQQKPTGYTTRKQ